MDGVTFTVEGADEIRRTLESLINLDDAIAEKAEDFCQIMRNTAVERLRDQDAVDTGKLRTSIETAVARVDHGTKGRVSVGIRTDVKYAIFIEYGTGVNGDPAVPHVPKARWVYPVPGKKATFRMAKAQKPRPFMRPALYDNRERFVAIIAGTVREIWDD